MTDTRTYQLTVIFHRTTQGREPVREWLLGLSRSDKHAIGEDIKAVQLGWPLGMPLVRKLEPGLWEVRIDVQAGISRVIFTKTGRSMVLLHGFIKKSQKTPRQDMNLARSRMKEIHRG